MKGGRCECCEGNGLILIEMHFLPDVYVPCDECHGARYNRDTLEVRYKGKNISEVLDMTVEDAYEFFKHIPQIAEFLFSGQAEGVLPPETTLKALADIPQAVDAGLSPEAMKKIEEDLAKL